MQSRAERNMLGVGMAMGLYDPAFATLTGLYGRAARGPITGITLIAGFASTIGWPLSAFLVLLIVASRHDLRLRTITWVPYGHSFGAGLLNATAGSVAVWRGLRHSVSRRGLGGRWRGLLASVGNAAAGWSAEASAISVSTSSVVGADVAIFQTISNRPSSLSLMP